MTKNWRKHPFMSVAGSIDSNGKITAKTSKEITAHSLTESSGKRWRWMIHSQEFLPTGPRTQKEIKDPMKELTLSDEEFFIICDWLVKNGYAGEEILPKGTV